MFEVLAIGNNIFWNSFFFTSVPTNEITSSDFCLLIQKYLHHSSDRVKKTQTTNMLLQKATLGKLQWVEER